MAKHTGSRFEIRGRTRAFHFVIVSRNGEIIATSETYTTKAMCKKGIQAITRAVCSIVGASSGGFVEAFDMTKGGR